MRLALVVGISDALAVGKTLYREDVQFERRLGLEPLVGGVAVVEGGIGDDVVVVLFACPDIVACT